MTTKAFDWTQTLKKYGGNKKTAKKIMMIFFAELPQAQKNINAAFEKKAIESLYAALHKLHGSLSFVSTPNLKAVTNTFFNAIKTCTPEELEHLKPLLKRFNAEVLRLMAYQKDIPKNASS
jgi:HPt (histidine-containing phosphotransfer) domain-containing protein